MAAVVIHGTAFCKRPSRGRRKSSGATVSRVSHRPTLQNIIFRAEPQRPKKIEDKTGIFFRDFYVSIVRKIEKFFLVLAQAVSIFIQFLELFLVNDTRTNHLYSQVPPCGRKHDSLRRQHYFFKRASKHALLWLYLIFPVSQATRINPGARNHCRGNNDARGQQFVFLYLSEW